jgi:calcium-dependent protein kinase
LSHWQKMDCKDAGEVRELFLSIDTNQSGTITLPELKKVLHKADREYMNDDENIEIIFSAIDYDGSGDIHYVEFLAALSETDGLITHDRLADSFDRIDGTGRGYIIHDDLKNILRENYMKGTAEKMIEEGDFQKNSLIDFDEFCQLFEGNAGENNGIVELDS